MYKIFSDNTLMYDSSLQEYGITKGQISKEINKSGSFTFTIPYNHPRYNTILKMKSIITVYKGDKKIFRGRVISEKLGFQKDKSFTCEGELGFLLDSIQRPYVFKGTPEDLFKQFIESHNSQVEDNKKFKVGTVTVTDPNNTINRSNEGYVDTFSELQSKLIDSLGGYMFITENEVGERVISWYKDSPYRSNQKIEFGENLLDFVKTNEAKDICTAVIPLGYEKGGSGAKTRLTIAEVNDGKDYVYNADAVDLYGWIFKTEIWDDVTVASNLKEKAEAFLTSKINQNITFELTAIDLSLIDRSIDSFELGDYISIISIPHNFNESYLLKKQTIDLLKPDNDKITLGYTFSTFTDTNASVNKDNSDLVKKVNVVYSNYTNTAVIQQEVTELKSAVEQTNETIKLTVESETSVNEELRNLISTNYTQLNNTFEFMFKTLDTSINENDNEMRAMFSEINKYIRFLDGDIYIGEIGNPLMLKLSLNRISFLENNIEVAYIDNNKIHITEARIINSLRLGNYALIPRETGNLSLMKVRV